MTVYIDTNIFIYALDSKSDFWRSARGVIADITSGKNSGVASVLVLTELMRKPSKLALEAVLATRGLEFVDIDRQIALKTAVLSGQFGRKLKAYDELHLATALIHKSRVFFTNDKDIVRLKVVEGMEVRPLI